MITEFSSILTMVSQDDTGRTMLHSVIKILFAAIWKSYKYCWNKLTLQ